VFLLYINPLTVGAFCFFVGEILTLFQNRMHLLFDKRIIRYEAFCGDVILQHINKMHATRKDGAKCF